MRGNLRRAVTSVITLFSLALVFVFASTAGASAPAPTDGSPGDSGVDSGPILPTSLFALGEVDLSSLGVSAAELAGAGPSVAATATGDDHQLIVDDSPLDGDCPNAEYLTIQAAVTAAAPGSSIKVCPGTYIEQVTIPAGKDGLTLFSEGYLQAVIKAPPAMAPPMAIVRVQGAHDITLRHFTITGPGGGPCNSIRYGVFVDDGGSATITDNHITEIHDTPFSGCQNGLGVAIGRNLPPDGPTTGSGTVVHNLIDNYQKGGVLVDNAGTSGEVAYNEVVGIGPTVIIAQNGIQGSRGAQVDIHHNKISKNFYAPPGTDATGILIFTDTIGRAHHNDIFLNEAGGTLFDVHGTYELSYNNARNNYDGIVAYSTTTNTLIAYNKAFDNTHWDCRDDTIPTPNRWVKDLGRTENQPGLCKNAAVSP
jgi:parallel beta-helix repeat protein